jgi:hypothetical protein
VQATRSEWVDGWVSAKYGATEIAAVGSGKVSWPWDVRLKAVSFGCSRSSGSTKALILLSEAEATMVVPSADLCLALADVIINGPNYLPLYALEEDIGFIVSAMLNGC